MVLDIIENYRNEHPDDIIVRLWNYSKSDLERFSQSINAVIKDSCDLWISETTYITRSEIKLQLKVGNTDLGIIPITEDEQIYHCILKVESFIAIHDMITNIVRSDLNGFQWLYDINTNIDLLLSKTGTW